METGNEVKKESKIFDIGLKLLLTFVALIVTPIVSFLSLIIVSAFAYHIKYFVAFLFPLLVFPIIWLKWKNKWKWFLIWLGITFVYLCVSAISYITITNSILKDEEYSHYYLYYTPSNNIGSKIASLNEESTLKLQDDFPIINGAESFIPFVSSCIKAVYPKDMVKSGSFDDVYGNYYALVSKGIDILIERVPNSRDIDTIQKYQEEGTNLKYTPIGYDPFVFFVHKDNPVDSLTVEQIKGIYSGEITNWKEVGGQDIPIKAYQQTDGFDNQSMLKKIMGNTPLMPVIPEYTPPFAQRPPWDIPADYRNDKDAIGFYYGYYITNTLDKGYAKNLKILKINGVSATGENIRCGAYPFYSPIYAVTYEGNPNKNVDILITWMLSEQGQELLSKSGCISLY